MSDGTCPHCAVISATADGLIRALYALEWPVKDIIQLLAYIHAQIRYKAVKDEGEQVEKEMLAYFNHMCDIQFEELNLVNPPEPKEFDKDFDFRTHMKNGE